MNWDALGAIAELVAAIGVIASLIYLAKQIGANTENVAQNTKALVSDRDVSSNEAALEIIGLQIKDPGIAALMLKGSLDEEPLSDLEHYRYSLILTSMFESHQTFFIQHVKGSVSEELWAYYSRVFDAQCHMPGLIKWWKRNGARFDPLFVEYVQAKIPHDV